MIRTIDGSRAETNRLIELLELLGVAYSVCITSDPEIVRVAYVTAWGN